jgi:hypothetical protein
MSSPLGSIGVVMTGIETRHVDPSNAEQAKAWDGDEGAY